MRIVNMSRKRKLEKQTVAYSQNGIRLRDIKERITNLWKDRHKSKTATRSKEAGCTVDSV